MHYILFQSLDEMNWFIGADFLANGTFPKIFHNVEGECVKSGHSFSNIKEAIVVMEYVQKILDGTYQGRKVPQSEIGIIYVTFQFLQSVPDE